MRLAIPEQKCDVGKSAGAETPTDRQMDKIAKAPSDPLPVVDFDWYRRKAIGDSTTTAGLVTDEQVAARARDIDKTAVLPPN
jgi:hypothetical protein